MISRLWNISVHCKSSLTRGAGSSATFDVVDIFDYSSNQEMAGGHNEPPAG
jgi:hypothetical protein